MVAVHHLGSVTVLPHKAVGLPGPLRQAMPLLPRDSRVVPLVSTAGSAQSAFPAWRVVILSDESQVARSEDTLLISDVRDGQGVL